MLRSMSRTCARSIYTLALSPHVRIARSQTSTRLQRAYPPGRTKMESGNKRDILSRLDAGEVILGDGSYVMTLEKRGYLKIGQWTPQAVCKHPDAVAPCSYSLNHPNCRLVDQAIGLGIRQMRRRRHSDVHLLRRQPAERRELSRGDQRRRLQGGQGSGQ